MREGGRKSIAELVDIREEKYKDRSMLHFILKFSFSGPKTVPKILTGFH